MKKKFIEIFSYLSITWVVFSGLFNGIFTLVFGASLTIIINTCFSVGLFLCSSRLKKYTRTEILFVVFYIALSFCFLLFYFERNHYGILKLLKNSILTFLSFFNIAIFFRYFKDFQLTGYLKKLFSMQLLIEIFFYLLFILYNKNDGMFARSNVQIFILQDWTGRFQGTFSEPSVLGMWLGTATLITLMIYKKIGRILAILLVCILYTACGAKFALIALPVSLIMALFYKFYNHSYNKYLLLAVCFMFALIGLWFDRFVFIFFEMLRGLLNDTSVTYSTRFGFIFSTIDNIFMFPLGQGFGMNYEYYQNLIYEVAPIANKAGFDTWEILSYATNPNNLGPKDTFSMITSSFGLIGLFLYLNYILNFFSLKCKQKYFVVSLVCFILIESVVSANIFSSSGLVFILFARMAINTNRITVEGRKCIG